MTTVIIFGILGGIGALIALVAFVFAVINLFRQDKFNWLKIGAGFAGGCILSAIAALTIGFTAVRNADKIVDKGESVAKKVVSGSFDKARDTAIYVSEAGTTAVGETLEGSVDHFVDKRATEMIAASKSLKLKFIGFDRSDDKAMVDFSIKNNTKKIINLNELVDSGVLVAVDTEGFEHPFSGFINTPKLIPDSNRRQQLSLKVADNITISGVKFVGQ